MKKFLVNSSVFALSFFTLVFLTGMISVSDDYIIHKTVNTSYEKLAWNLNFINRYPEKVRGSSVFLGSSLMLADISDSVLRANAVRAINFGMNGTGHEVVLYFLERIIPLAPRKIYIHTYKFDKSALHDMTPLLYTPYRLLSKGQSFSMYFFRFLLKRVYFVADYLLWKMNRSLPETTAQPVYGAVYRKDVFKSEKYAAIQKAITDDYFYSFNLHRNDFIKEEERTKSGFYFKLLPYVRSIRYGYTNSEFMFNCRSQSRFALRCLALCKESKIETIRLYLPMVADAKINKDFDETFYVPRGEGAVVSLRNFSFLDSACYWADMAHMSREAALVFTEKLLHEKIIRP